MWRDTEHDFFISYTIIEMKFVELLYNWASLKSLFYNTLVYLSKSWKYDRDWHCNNYICATSKKFMAYCIHTIDT